MTEDLSRLTSELASKYDYKAAKEAGSNREPSQGSFLEAAGSAFGEYYLGAEPTSGAQAYTADNPKSGFAAEMLPILAGAGAAVKARNVFKSYDEAIEGFAQKGGTKFSQGAREAVATMAPVEAVRIAGTLAANPEAIGETLKESIFNLGLEGAGGALYRAMTAGGKVIDEPPFVADGGNLKNPNQLKLRELRTQLDSGKIPADQLDMFKGKISDLERAVRVEQVGNRPLELTLANEGNGRELSRLFRDSSSQAGNIKKARLIQSTSDFADSLERDRVINASGLNGNWDAVQLPRYVGFKSDQWAKKVSDDLTKRAGMTAVDDKTLLVKEKSGMFTMARKVTGDIANPTASDEWVVWRTDQPGRFVPGIREFADKVSARMAFLREDNLRIDPAKPASIMDATKRLVSQTPITNFMRADEEFGALKSGADKIAKALGYEPGAVGSSFAVQRGKAAIEQYFTPKLQQFKSNPLAKYIIGHSDMAFARAKQITNQIVNGEVTDPSAIKFTEIFGNPETKGTYQGVRALKGIVESLSEEDLSKLREVADIVAGTDDPLKTINSLRASGEISESLFNGLKDLDKLDEKIVNDLVNHQRAAGRADLNPLKGHLMLSRVWDGDYRAPIFNEQGELVYIAAGDTPEAADKIAKALIKEGKLNGMKIIPAERYDAIQDLELAGRIATKSRDFQVMSAANKKLRSSPVTFRERTGVEGYKKTYSKKELLDRLQSHVSERYNYMARTSVDTALERELAQLHDNDPKAFAAVQDRLRQMAGKPGPIGQAINSATDKLLKPVMGRNSATKISGYLNEYFYHTQLGMGNALFPIMNAITFMQTVLPEAAYVMNAADNRIIRDYYDVFLAGGSDLKPRGNLGALSPAKTLIKSFSQMAKGESDQLYGQLLKRARDEGVIDPQLMQEFIGKSSEMGTRVKDVLSGDEPFINLIRTWSNFLPSKSERFARGQAFTTGYLLGKDVMNMEGETLYQFARKFTERTMYNYSTADRATIMTGPLGRMFGLFKNWQTHYIFSMLQYAEEGVKYGNWSSLLWQMGGTGAVGGTGALGAYGLADKFSQMASDESLMTNIYQAFGPGEPEGLTGTFSDAVFMGLPAFLGVSLTGNIAAPGHDPSRDAAQLMSFPQWDRMRRLGQAVGGAIDNWAATGQHPISSPEIRDQFVAALAPKMLARSMQVVEGAALRSLNTGNVILKDMSLAERLMYGAGITPRRVGIAYEVADELWKEKEKKKELTSQYGRAWAEAQLGGDWDKLENLRQEAMVLGLDISSVTRSANAFREKKTTSHVERTFSPEARRNLQELGLPGF